MDNSTIENKNSGTAKQAADDLKNLPKLDGRFCIIAGGETVSRKTLLMAARFKWNAQQRSWWKYADIA